MGTGYAGMSIRRLLLGHHMARAVGSTAAIALGYCNLLVSRHGHTLLSIQRHSQPTCTPLVSKIFGHDRETPSEGRDAPHLQRVADAVVCSKRCAYGGEKL